jgi:hypothetical protein
MSQNFETAQPTGRRLLWKMLEPIAASPVRTYAQLDWRFISPKNISSSDGSPVQFKIFSRDKTAGPLPSTWEKAGKLVVPQSSLEKVQTKYPNHREAVVCRWLGGVLIVGELPEGIRFGIDPASPENREVLPRIGSGPWLGTMGLFKRGAGFVEPPGVQAEKIWTIESLAEWLPDSPIV